jgi:hypothetical protein
MIAFRIGRVGLAAVDRAATRENVSRSDLLRLLVQFGLREMPPGWRPDRNTTECPTGPS